MEIWSNISPAENPSRTPYLCPHKINDIPNPSRIAPSRFSSTFCLETPFLSWSQGLLSPPEGLLWPPGGLLGSWLRKPFCPFPSTLPPRPSARPSCSIDLPWGLSLWVSLLPLGRETQAPFCLLGVGVSPEAQVGSALNSKDCAGSRGERGCGSAL